MASQIGSLSIDLEAKLAKFESDMGRAARIAAKEMEKMRQQVNRQLQQVNDQLTGFSNQAANAVKGLAAAFSVREITQFAKKSIDIADSINDMSKKFGISTQAISVWRLTAEKSGTSLDGIARAAKFLIKDVEKSDFYLKQIGVSMTDLAGKSRPVEDVLADVATKFAGFEDGAEKAAFATQLFGRAGVDLIPFLNDFGENADEARLRAEQFGAVIGSDLAAASDQFNDNMRNLQAVTEGFANSLLSQLLPALNNYIEIQTDAVRKGDEFANTTTPIVDGLKNIAIGFVIAKNAVDLFIEGIKFIVTAGVAQFTAAQQAVGAFSEYMQEAGRAIANPFDDNTLDAAKQRFYAKISEIGSGMVQAFQDASKGFGDSLDQNIQDVADAFEAFGSKTKPVGDAVENVNKGIKSAVPNIVKLSDAEKEAAAAATEAKKALSEWAKLQKAHDAELMKSEDIMIKQALAVEGFEASVRELLRSYDEEIELLGLDTKAREQLEIQLRAEEDIRRLLAEAAQNGINLTEEEIQAIKGEIRARAEALQVAKQQAEVAEEFQRSWEGAIQSINAAFADFLTGGLKDFKGFGESLSRISQDFFSDIIEQTLKAGGGFKDLFANIKKGFGGPGFSLQGGMMALGSAYGAYQSYRQGDTFGTVSGAAMAGGQLGAMAGMPVVGAVVGAIIGAVASAFRSNKPPDIRIGGANSRVRNAEENFSTALGDFKLGTREIERTPLIEGLKDFDKMIKQMLEAAGVGSEQMARIRESLQSVVLDLKGDSATAENVLKARFDAILGTFDAATQEYVRAGADLQEQVQRLGEKLEFPKQLQALLDQLAEEDQLAVMSDLERQIFQINKQFDAMVEQATFLGATQEQLAQIEQYRANTLARLNDVQQGASVDEYARAVAELNNEFIQLTTGLRPGKLANALFEIRKEESGRIQTLNRLARESGRAGAAEEDLATVHKIAAAKAAQAIAQMRSAAESLVQQLYGGGGIGGSSPAQEAAASLDSTAEDLFAGWESALESIRGFLDSILLDEGLTVLTPQQQLLEAQRQYRATLSSAQSGDSEAASRLPELARQLLDNARAFFASGSGYDQIFADVMAGLQSVQGIAPGPGTTGGAEQAINQAELAAEDVEQQRMLMAVELAGYIKELSDAMGENVFALTEELGINLTAFVNDLGVDITNMTATTAAQLADIANMLGVELPELAYQLGVSLGSLRETNSLINDALESAINDQPPEIADELRPYLAAVENAVTDADANAAIESLNSAVSRIGGATAVALAPYLENVDPPSMYQEIDLLSALWAINNEYMPQIEEWLAQIAASVRDEPAAPPTSGSFATGTSYVPYDMTAEIHRGEKIIDSKTSALLDQYGIAVRPVRSEKSGDDSARLVRELMQRLSDQEVKSARREERLTAAIERLAFSGSRGR